MGRGTSAGRGIVCGAVLVASCVRSFEVPPAGNRTVGAPCAAAAECLSGVCAEGFCCAAACAAAETCAAPGKAGVCTARELGAACADGAQCPGGHCVDGACCESACDSACRSCAAAGRRGSCVDAPDNTDGRGECGVCGACFGGVCAPALVGTDPNHACGAGLTCGASQACGVRGGGACAADANCAVGACIAGTCLDASAELIFAEPMAAAPTGRTVTGLAANDHGEAAVVFDEYLRRYDSVSDTFDTVANDLLVALRDADGRWKAAVLHSDLDNLFDGVGMIPAGVAYLGRAALVATYNDTATLAGECGAGFAVPCGVFARLITAGGQLGGVEEIDPAARLVDWISLRVDAHGRALVAYRDDEDLVVRRREPGAGGAQAWVSVDRLPSVLSAWDFAVVGDRPILVVADDASSPAKLVAHRLDPREEADIVALPEVHGDACAPISLWSGSNGGASGDAAVATAICDQSVSGWSNGAVLGVYRPGAAAESRWEVRALPDFLANAHPATLAGGTPVVAVLAAPEGPGLSLIGWPGTGSAWEERNAYAPRGEREVWGVFGGPGPGGLPWFVAGVGTRDGSTHRDFGVDLYLVRYQP